MRLCSEYGAAVGKQPANLCRGDMADKNENLSKAMMGNQNAVSPDTGGAAGARRDISEGKPFSERVTRRIAAIRKRVDDGELRDVLVDEFCKLAGVADILGGAVLAVGSNRKKSKAFQEYLRQYHTYAASTLRFGLQILPLLSEEDKGVDLSKFRGEK